MINRNYASVLMTILVISIQAQDNGRGITGTVISYEGQKLQGATVSLLNANDSTFIEGKITDSDGNFNFGDLKTGKYELRIAHLGYHDLLIPVVDLSDKDPFIRLPYVVLKENTEELEEVVVVSDKPLIERQIDRTVINVESMVGANTNNSLEILQRSPGVHVDENAMISLNGKSNVLILIDGRETYLSGQDLANYLKTLPGVVLDRLELIDNPSARYNASGSAIINVVLKKIKLLGFTGNVYSENSQGILFRSVEGLNLNYRVGKFNWFTSFNYSHGANISDLKGDRRLFDDNGLLFSTVNTTYGTFKNNSMYGRLGLDYHLNKESVLGCIFFANDIPNHQYDTFDIAYMGGEGQIDSLIGGSIDSNTKWNNLGFVFDLQHKKKNSELSVRTFAYTYDTENTRLIENYNVGVNGSRAPIDNFQYAMAANTTIFNMAIDATHTPKEDLNLEYGVKTSSFAMARDLDFMALDIEPSGKVIGQSNRFIYKEQVYSFYSNIREKKGKFGWQLGIRAEGNHIKGLQEEQAPLPKIRLDQNYLNLFPSAFLEYQIDSVGKHIVSINLTRRIVRPNFQMFNPVIEFRDYNLYTAGNPGLQPYYPLRLELSYLFKPNITLNVGFQSARGTIVNAIAKRDNYFVESPVNLGKNVVYNLGLSFAKNLTNWWYANYNMQIQRIETSGSDQLSDLSIENLSKQLSASNQFTISKNWKSEVSLYYTGRNFIQGFIREPRAYMNISVQKQFLDGRGSITLLMDDIFYSWRSRTRQEGLANSSYNSDFRFDSRRIRFSFSYRFGKDKFARSRSRNERDSDLNRL